MPTFELRALKRACYLQTETRKLLFRVLQLDSDEFSRHILFIISLTKILRDSNEFARQEFFFRQSID